MNLIKQAAQRNYLTSHQVKSLLEVVSYRKGKLEVSITHGSKSMDLYLQWIRPFLLGLGCELKEGVAPRGDLEVRIQEILDAMG